MALVLVPEDWDESLPLTYALLAGEVKYFEAGGEEVRCIFTAERSFPAPVKPVVYHCETEKAVCQCTADHVSIQAGCKLDLRFRLDLPALEKELCLTAEKPTASMMANWGAAMRKTAFRLWVLATRSGR